MSHSHTGTECGTRGRKRGLPSALPTPLLQLPAPRGPQAPQALPRACQCPPGAPHLVRRPPIPSKLLGKGPTSQDIGTWVASPLGEGTGGGIWVFRLWAPRLFPHWTAKVLLCAWGSAVDAGKTTKTGPYSESCAVWGKSRPDQSTQSSYVNMVVWDGYYGEIPVTGVLVSVWEGD